MHIAYCRNERNVLFIFPIRFIGIFIMMAKLLANRKGRAKGLVRERMVTVPVFSPSPVYPRSKSNQIKYYLFLFSFPGGRGWILLAAINDWIHLLGFDRTNGSTGSGDNVGAAVDNINHDGLRVS